MLKTGQQLLNARHVLRRVPWARLRRDDHDNVLGFLPSAFELRDGEEALSVNWVEYHQGATHAERVVQCVAELRAAAGRQGKQIGQKAGFGIADVGRVRDVCSGRLKAVRIVYTPTQEIPSHASIKKLPKDDFELLEALAADAFTEMVMNRDIPAA